MIYADRHRAVGDADLKSETLEMLRNEYSRLVVQYLPGRHSDDWNAEGFLDELGQIGPVPEELDDEDKVFGRSLEQITSILSEHAERIYGEREEAVGSEQMRLAERFLLLSAIDSHWIQHLTAMENLRTGIGLHAYGQRNPLVMYQSEGQKMFLDLQGRIQRYVVRNLFRFGLDTGQAASHLNGGTGPRRNRSGGSPTRAATGSSRNAQPSGSAKVGRNAACPCGSGRKYKRCCGKAA